MCKASAFEPTRLHPLENAVDVYKSSDKIGSPSKGCSCILPWWPPRYSTFELSATMLLSQPFSARRCLATFFPARSLIYVKLSRCIIILVKLQTSNWAHFRLEHMPEPGWWRKPPQRCVENWLFRPVFFALVNCLWKFCNQDFTDNGVVVDHPQVLPKCQVTLLAPIEKGQIFPTP